LFLKFSYFSLTFSFFLESFIRFCLLRLSQIAFFRTIPIFLKMI
jgi:hypothetical protein